MTVISGENVAFDLAAQQMVPSLDNKDISVKIDKYKMEQVVRNFLTNALKFTAEHGMGNIAVNVAVQRRFSMTDEVIVGKVKRGAKRSKDCYPDMSSQSSVLRVEVVDNGPGIKEVHNFCLLYFLYRHN